MERNNKNNQRADSIIAKHDKMMTLRQQNNNTELLKHSQNLDKESHSNERKTELAKIKVLKLNTDDSQLENSFDSRYKMAGPLKVEYDKLRYKIFKKVTSPEEAALPLTKRFNPN